MSLLPAEETSPVSSEPGHVQITEFNKEAIPMVNWMMEDLFCQYGVAMPWFMLDFDFPDYSERPDWVSGYNFNLDWGTWGYWLTWFNYLLGLLFDTAKLPRWQMPDLSPGSWAMYNDYINMLYDESPAIKFNVYSPVGTFLVDENVVGEDSEVEGKVRVVIYNYLTLENVVGTLVANEGIIGATSGATATIGVIDDDTLQLGDANDRFVINETITGQTSGATATIQSVRAELRLRNVTGTFIDEKVTGQTSGAYAWTADWMTQNIFGSVGTFIIDETVTGETSEATGTIKAIADDYLMLSDVVGTFSDEKIVGQTSGAYAYTYEDYVVWYSFSAGSGAWFYNWQQKPMTWTDYATAMAKYVTEPDPTIHEESPLDFITIAWYSVKRDIYFEVSANQSYAKFNTSSLLSAEEAKFVIRSSTITVHNVGEYPTIEVYAYDYGDPLSMADWTGGTKVGEKQLTSDDNGEDIEIEIDADSVNLDGYSKYMITSTRIANNNFWPEPPDDDYYNMVTSSNIARLKVKGTK